MDKLTRYANKDQNLTHQVKKGNINEVNNFINNVSK